MIIENKKIAFLFPGQGSQFVGMGQGFVSENNALECFSRADDILGFSISNMCWDGPEEELRLTENAQPALLLTGYVAAMLFEKKGIVPDYTAGHSLGEYTALTFSGAFTLEEGLGLVRKRGEMMSKAVPIGIGGMAALLGVDKELVLGVINDVSKDGNCVEMANLNCPGQIVIAGHKDAVLRACKVAGDRGARRTIMLDVAVPSHTSLMEPIKSDFEAFLDGVGVKSLRIPVVNNIKAEVVTDSKDIKESLIAQLTNSVLWEDSIKKLISLGVNVFIEMGAGRVLSGLVKKIERKVTAMSVSCIDDFEKACSFLLMNREENNGV